MFQDPDCADSYCADYGRDSVSSSLLATALPLRSYAKVSDAACYPVAQLEGGLQAIQSGPVP